MQKVTLLAFAQERNKRILLHDQLAEARDSINSLRDRNGTQSANIRCLERKIAEQQYKLRRLGAINIQCIAKVSALQEEHATRSSLQSAVSSSTMVVCVANSPTDAFVQRATSAEHQLRELRGVIHEFLQQHSAILSQLSPLLAASAPARSVLVLLRQLQLAGDKAAQGMQDSTVSPAESHSAHNAVDGPLLDRPALWGRLEDAVRRDQAPQQIHSSRPPRAAERKNVVQASSTSKSCLASSGAVRSRRKAQSAQRTPAARAKQRSRGACSAPQGQSSTNRSEYATKESGAATSSAHVPSGRSQADRLLQMMALTAQCAQEDAATAQAALQGTQRELQFAQAAAASAPSNAALLAAARAADRLEASSSRRAALAEPAPPAVDEWEVASSASGWGDSPLSSIGASPSEATQVTVKRERELTVQSLGQHNSPAGTLSRPASAPEQPGVRAQGGHGKPSRKGQLPMQDAGRSSNAAVAAPDLRADDDDKLPSRALSGRGSASGLVARALSEAKGADSYVSSAKGCPVDNEKGPAHQTQTLDEEISALEHSLAALGISGSSGSNSSGVAP